MQILTHLNLQQNELQNAVIHKLATAPEGAVVGQIYFNTTDNKAYIYTENNGWEIIGLSGDLLEKLNGIEEGAEVNLLEGIQVNGTDLTIDENKKINLTNATTTTAGLMSAEDKAALDAAVAKNGTQDTAIAGINEKITALETKDTELVAKDTELANKIAGLETKDTELAAKDTEQDGRLTALEGKDTELGNKITALETKDGEIDTAIEGLEAKDLELEGAIDDLEAKDLELVAEDERLAGLIGDNADDIAELGTTKQDKLVAGTNITIGEDGKTINATIPTASTETLGGIKVGAGLSINAETGVLDVVEGGKADSVEWEGVLNAPSTLGSENAPAGTYTKVTIDKYGLVTAGGELEAEDIPDLSDTYINVNQKGVANGVATLDANAKINLDQIPDTLLGNVRYGGTFDPATGVCTLVDGKILGEDGVEYTELTITADNAENFRGYYFLATGSATLAGIDFLVGDWCISNGTAGWAKVDNTDAVTGIKGNNESTYRIGQVNLTAENIGAVEANEAITGGTFAKVTVDEKGLVTAGEEKLTMADIEDIADLGTTYVALDQGEDNANKAVVTDENGNITTVARKFVTTIGDGTAKTFTVTHNLNSRDILVQIMDATTHEVVMADIAINADNSIAINFETAPAANGYRVIIIA